MGHLASLVVLSCLPAVFVPSPEWVLVAGDVNSSGSVDAVDVQLVTNAALGLPVQGRPDVDYSGEADALDVQLVINAALSLSIDTDGDGLCNAAETHFGTLPDQPDSDGDGIGDGVEAACGSSPTDGTVWARTLGGPQADGVYSVQPIPGGGFVLAGVTASGGAGGNDMYVARTDASGSPIWEAAFGGSQNEDALCAIPTSDGGFVAVGYTESYGAGKKDAYLVKMDADGDFQWQRTFGGSDDDRAYSVHETSTGGLAVVGYTKSFGGQGRNIYLVMTDAEGNHPVEKNFGGAGSDFAFSVDETYDHGFIIAGSTDGWGTGDYDVYLLRTDSAGDYVWDKTFSAQENQAALFVRETAEHGFILAGYTHLLGHLDLDMYLIKTDSDGNMVWDGTYGGNNDDLAQAVSETTDGGFVAAGYTYSFGAGGADAYVVKTGAELSMVWDETYGGSQNDGGAAIQLDPNGGFIVAGYTESYGVGSDDIFVLRIGEDGHI